jgi:hypothetical protein
MRRVAAVKLSQAPPSGGMDVAAVRTTAGDCSDSRSSSRLMEEDAALGAAPRNHNNIPKYI